MTPPAGTRIAIVGAGVAGLSAARRLREKGYRHITLFEKEAAVGGKVCSVLHEGRFHELGALWSSPRYRVVNQFAREAGVARRGARLPDVLEAGVLQDYAGYMWRHFRPAQLAAEFLRLGKALWTFPAINHANLLSQAPGTSDNFQQFAEREGFGQMAGMARSFVSGCGYLHNETVPAPYLMKLMHIVIDVLVLDVLRVSRNRMTIHEQGWQSVWQSLARDFDVRASARISAIRRGEDQGAPRIEIVADGKPESFDRLVIAAPLDECGSFLDLGDEERDLFSRIRTNRYRVTLVEARNLPHASMMDNAVPGRIGRINLVARQHADTDVFTLYQQLGDGVTGETADRWMREDIAEMGGTLTRVVTSRLWKYFPHVSGDDIRAGFYQRLDRLQGARGTFYVGGVLNLEAVEHTARSAMELIDRKFLTGDPG